MDEIVVKFNNVTKMYKLYKNDKKRLLAIFFKRVKYKEKKAVDNVSFNVKKGESLAIFGKNGARKINYIKNDNRSNISK